MSSLYRSKMRALNLAPPFLLEMRWPWFAIRGRSYQNTLSAVAASTTLKTALRLIALSVVVQSSLPETPRSTKNVSGASKRSANNSTEPNAPTLSETNRAGTPTIPLPASGSRSVTARDHAA